MIEKIFNNNNNNLVVVVYFIIVYVIGNNIFYFSAAYSDLPSEINKIENCKNGKIVKKAISKSIDKSNNNNIEGIDTMATIENFNHIKKFNSNGVLINSWGNKGTGKGEFLHPHGIGYDSKGNIYVSDAVLCNIQKFDNNGRYLLKFGSRGNG